MAVTNNATLISDHEGTAPTYTSIGGGQGAGQESNFFFRGVESSSRKQSGTTKEGFWFNPGSTFDLSGAGEHVKLFINVITQASFTDFWIRLGSTTTDYEEFAVTTAFYDNDAGGWIPVWVEVNAGTDTGTPGFTIIDEFAILADIGSISGNVKNFITDQAHHSQRPVLLWDGTGGDLDDFITTELTAGTGALKLTNGIYTCFANLEIGSATNTTFTMAGKTIAFPDATWLPSGSTWMGLDFNIDQAATVLTCTGGSIISGNPSGASARKPDIIVAGNAGTIDFSNRVFDGMRIITFTDGVTANNCVFANSGVLTLSEADISGSGVITSTVAADLGAVLDTRNTTTATSLTEYTGCTFVQGSNAHHAIQFGDAVDDNVTLTNVAFNGFSGTDDVDGSTFRFDNVAGTFNLNLVNCTVDGGSATVSNIGIDSAATITIVIDPVSTTVNVDDNTGTSLANAVVLLEAADGAGDLPFEEVVTITNSTTTATVLHTAHGLIAGDLVVIRNANESAYNGTFAVSISGPNEYTYTMGSDPGGNATGTIDATGALIQDTTTGTGTLTSSRSWGADQNVRGFVRKSLASPRFKSFPLSGNTVSSASGLTINVRMVLDE